MISLQVLTKKKQNIRMIYPDSRPPTSPPSPHISTPLPRKVTANLNLTCKNIYSKVTKKAKTNEKLPAAKEKI